MRTVFMTLIILASPTWAQTPISASDFDEYATGKTITYGKLNGPYGQEQYLDGRRVRWALENGECIAGTWYEKGDQICFEYETDTGPQCWLFFLSGHGLWARYVSGPSATVVYERSSSTDPLFCPGPKVGS